MLRHLNTDSLTNILFYSTEFEGALLYLQLREAIVIPILAGKAATDPLSYCPIALTSCFCKTFERMINTRFGICFGERKVYFPLQSGFRKGRSTLDNLVFLESQIRDAFVRETIWFLFSLT
ncbi:putative RNA-directed DNA polymerase from transposon X-element [Trichonephila clavipes]|nr:putative RNA-directed DNA polymerase from transposon X-element [Trichonephila clavipes]